jgi:hypothetical protein
MVLVVAVDWTSRPANCSRAAGSTAVPVIGVLNKLDRESRDPFDLIDEIEESLALNVTRASRQSAWGPLSRHLFVGTLLLFECVVHDWVVDAIRGNDLGDPKLRWLLPKRALDKLRSSGARDSARTEPAVRAAEFLQTEITSNPRAPSPPTPYPGRSVMAEEWLSLRRRWAGRGIGGDNELLRVRHLVPKSVQVYRLVRSEPNKIRIW